jgi:hypothetical protein
MTDYGDDFEPETVTPAPSSVGVGRPASSQGNLQVRAPVPAVQVVSIPIPSTLPQSRPPSRIPIATQRVSPLPSARLQQPSQQSSRASPLPVGGVARNNENKLEMPQQDQQQYGSGGGGGGIVGVMDGVDPRQGPYYQAMYDFEMWKRAEETRLIELWKQVPSLSFLPQKGWLIVVYANIIGRIATHGRV